MASRKHPPNGHDLLTEVSTRQQEMQTTLNYVKDKIEVLYRIDPPGPLMQIAVIAGDHGRVMKSLYGNPDGQEDSDERKGILLSYQDHLSAHKKALRIALTLMTAVATSAGVIVDRVLGVLGFK